MTDHTPLGPLPEYAREFRPRWPGDEGGFTGAQMRVYARQERAAERERWRELARRCIAALDDYEACAYGSPPDEDPMIKLRADLVSALGVDATASQLAEPGKDSA
jgi:hypothetical protein